MANAKAKTINLLLYEGNLKGVISIEDSSWNSGELYSAPRESISKLLETDACNKYGVYLLLSQEKVYVGQSTDLAKRITQHTVGKDWWESVVILTTSDNRFDHAAIDYLENLLIEKAFDVNSLDCDNKRKGNPPKISKFQKVSLDQYLEEALFLMELIGITVFETKKKSASSHSNLFCTVDMKTKLVLGKRAKKEALQFLAENGISVGKDVNYAVRQADRDDCWANPKVEMLDKEWTIILNDNMEHELIVLEVPANSFSLKENGQKGLYVRADKPELIDLKINLNTFRDIRSNEEFEPYIIHKVKY